MDKWELNHHRTFHLRGEARLALLAYAYLRGKPRSLMDRKYDPKWDSISKRVKDKIKKVTGLQIPIEEIELWMTE